MAKDGTLKYPVISVNDALTKHMFDIVTAPGNPQLTASCAPPTC